MKLSEKGAALMHQYEGCRNKPYQCPAHIWTIGYGHVLYQDQIRLPMVRVEGKEVPMIRKEYPLRPEHGRVWSKEEIDALFRDDVASLNAVFYDLLPAWLGIKALSTHAYLFPLMLA